MQIKDIITKTTQFFKDKGFETPRLDTELLISTALHWERMKLYLNYEYPLSEQELNSCRDLVRRRASGEPVAYILGHKDFFKHSFAVTPAVLIPRPDTETLVEKAIEWAQENTAAPRIVDLGTGSGCIGLSVVSEISDAKLLAVDLSADALAIAAKNAESLSLIDRVQFLELDAALVSRAQVMASLGGLADLVVANPPYIAVDDPDVEANVRKFEPHMALFADEKGLALVRTWSAQAAELVRADGFVMFEIGCDQGAAAKQIFEQTGFYNDVEIVKDLSGRERFIRALRKGEEN